MTRMPQHRPPHQEPATLWQFLDRLLGHQDRFRRFIVLVLLLLTALTHPEALEQFLQHVQALL